MLPVSVIIPIYNHERFIERCLMSIGEQAEQPAAIILVDNGSTDRSVAVAEGLGLPNLRVVRNGANAGATLARWTGFQHVETPYISFLDSDDYLGRDALALCYEQALRFDLDISLFRCLRVDLDASTVSPFIAAPDEPVSGAQAFELSLGAWSIHGYGIFRAEIYRRCMAQFEVHGFSDDEVLTRHLFLAADRVCGSDGEYFYRDVPKPYTFDKVLKQTRTNLRVLGIAASRRDLLGSDRPLREMRNVVTRNLLGLAGRALKSGEGKAEVRALLREQASLKVPWRAADWRFRAMDRALATLLVR